MIEKTLTLSVLLARKLIAEQFPEYADLPISDVEKQGYSLIIHLSLALVFIV